MMKGGVMRILKQDSEGKPSPQRTNPTIGKINIEINPEMQQQLQRGSAEAIAGLTGDMSSAVATSSVKSRCDREMSSMTNYQN